MFDPLQGHAENDEILLCFFHENMRTRGDQTVFRFQNPVCIIDKDYTISNRKCIPFRCFKQQCPVMWVVLYCSTLPFFLFFESSTRITSYPVPLLRWQQRPQKGWM
jgi:hypothetical protein